MLRKIILPLVLLLFAQQNFYGMEGKKKNTKTFMKIVSQYNKKGIWVNINNWVNRDATNRVGFYPRLWWLWAILDNVPFQYGGSKIWKYGEAYYGLSNGIGFFLSHLNFGSIKIGIVDAHINVINFILNYFKIYVGGKYITGTGDENTHTGFLKNIIPCLYYTFIVTGIHLLSFNLFNCVKIKIISIGGILNYIIYLRNHPIIHHSWYFRCWVPIPTADISYTLMSYKYLVLSPRIEINISEIINYFKGQ